MRKVLYLFIFLTLGAFYASFTNPYSQLGETAPIFSYKVDSDGQFEVEINDKPRFVETPYFLNYVSLQSLQAFFRILGDAWLQIEKPFEGTANEVITKIHEKRFDTSKPYVISGRHFSELYTRNKGIFYNAMLDPRFALSDKDWAQRQQIISSTVLFHLTILEQADKVYTTFYPIWRNIYSGVDVYAEPSDSLFAVFYTLRAMTDENFIPQLFPAQKNTPVRSLQTKRIGKELLEQYDVLLEQRTEEYLNKIIAPYTGLIRSDILLSGARDQIKRESSFYDNVIAWATVKMANELGLQIACPLVFQQHGKCDIQKWKETIIDVFWDADKGIFIDDLSPQSREEKSFSADILIVTSASFLDVTEEADRSKLTQIVKFIQDQGLDEPLPLRYANYDQHDKLYPVVKACAESYMGETHWSHWGMEYIKAMIILSPYETNYRVAIHKALSTYRNKIEEFGGYLELYNKEGKPYQTWCYKSMLHTGWVINYEQASFLANM